MKHYLVLLVGCILFSVSGATAQWKKMNWVDTNYVSAFVSSGDTLFAATKSPLRVGEGIFRSTDNGSTWTLVGDTSIVKATTSLIIIGDTMFAVNIDLDLVRSTDKGVTWESMGTRKKEYFFSALLHIGNTVIGIGSDVFRSTDNGNSWTKTSDPRGGNSAYLSNAAALGNFLFVTTSHGVFRTSNFGDSWTRCDDSTLGSDRIEPIAIKDTNIFVANIKGFFRSQDTGKTWQMINSMPYNEFAFSDDVYFAASGELNYLGGSNQLDNSLDGGTSWIFNVGLPDKFVTKLIIHNGYVIAALGDGGIWRRRVSEYTSVANNITSPSSIQNYPNPFASSTTITFTLPSPSNVIITISDALGNEIQLSQPKWYEARQHSITWDGSNYPSGVYSCRIIANGVRETWKMVVLK